MSVISLLNIDVLNNPSKFSDPYEFEITFECLDQLSKDLEWKLTYVGSSKSLEHDQELDSILVGPIPIGINKFKFVADPPSPELIPANELVSVTVILLSCSYDSREFVRVGYYVNNEYDNEEMKLEPPKKVDVQKVVRNILAEKPRVTRFNIVWDNEDDQEIVDIERNSKDGEEDDDEGRSLKKRKMDDDEDDDDEDEEEEEEEEEDEEDDEDEEEIDESEDIEESDGDEDEGDEEGEAVTPKD